MMNLTDIHCHILPYVDDGAVDMDEALELLTMEANQGVSEICLTPHLREEMFTTPDSKILSVFDRLKAAAEENAIPAALHLSREYYYSPLFRKVLAAGEVIPMGRRTLLIEFSYHASCETLEEAALEVLSAGYSPLFAHVERYMAIQDNPGEAAKLIGMGVKLQVNAASILGKDGWHLKRVCKRLLKEHSIFAVASDTHDTEVRVPYMEKCRKYLEKKFGRDYAQELMEVNPLSILSL